jgi:hypothetical protein
MVIDIIVDIIFIFFILFYIFLETVKIVVKDDKKIVEGFEFYQQVINPKIENPETLKCLQKHTQLTPPFFDKFIDNIDNISSIKTIQDLNNIYASM